MKNIKILGLLDNLTYQGLKLENNVTLLPLLKNNFWNKLNKPDLIIVESAWFGYHNHWKHNLVNFPSKCAHLENLIKILEWAKVKNIPCIFWNKEDPIHFDKFIQCAELFDLIATTDSDCISRYPKRANPFYLPFAYQPKIHYKSNIPYNLKINRGLFMGSYLNNTHPKRKLWQDTYFPIFANYGLDIYDRNSYLKNKNYVFPNLNNTKIYKSVPYNKTGKIMRNYLYSINVNTITESPTMFSRRVLESLASGCITFSNKSRALDLIFKDSCIQINNEDQLNFHLEEINNNYHTYINLIEYNKNLTLINYSYTAWLKKILKNFSI